MTFKRFSILALLCLSAGARAEDLVDTRSLSCIKGREALDHHDLRTTCTSRFPARRSSIEAAYAAWFERNEAVLSRLDTVCEERLSKLRQADPVGYETLQALGQQFRAYAKAQMEADEKLESACLRYAEVARIPGDMDVKESVIDEIAGTAPSPKQAQPRAVIPQVDGYPAGVDRPRPPPEPVQLDVGDVAEIIGVKGTSAIMAIPASGPSAGSSDDHGPKDPRAWKRCQEIIDEWQARPENKGRGPVHNDC